MDNDIQVNDQVLVQYENADTDATVTHIRDTDDSPNKYRLLRTEDGWYLGWYTADQLTLAEPQENTVESEKKSEESEDGGTDDA